MFLPEAKKVIYLLLSAFICVLLRFPCRADTKSQKAKAPPAQKLPALHPKSILFVEKKPLAESAKAFYEVASEPKEMLLLNETAAGELIGADRDTYNEQLWKEIQKYFPPVSNEQTLELKH